MAVWKLSNVVLILLSGYLKQMHKKGEDKVVIIHVNEMTRSIGKLILKIVVLFTWEKQQEFTVVIFMSNTVLAHLVKT